MQHSTFERWTSIYPGCCRHVPYSALAKWWQCCFLRTEWVWTLRHSAFGWGNFIHPGFCTWPAYCDASEWWHCSCLWRKWLWTMQHSDAGYRTVIHPCFRRFVSYSAASKWWYCGCLWRRYQWTLWHSGAGAWNVVRFRPWNWRRCCATRISWGRTDLLRFGRKRSVALEDLQIWFGLGDSQADSTWLECQVAKSQSGLAQRPAFVIHVQCKSRGHCRCCDGREQASDKLSAQLSPDASAGLATVLIARKESRSIRRDFDRPELPLSWIAVDSQAISVTPTGEQWRTWAWNGIIPETVPLWC